MLAFRHGGDFYRRQRRERRTEVSRRITSDGTFGLRRLEFPSGCPSPCLPSPRKVSRGEGSGSFSGLLCYPFPPVKILSAPFAIFCRNPLFVRSQWPVSGASCNEPSQNIRL